MTRGQQLITELAEAIERDTGNSDAIFALQQIAGVTSDGLYGPQTAGVLSFVLNRAPPPTRSGKVTPYEPIPNSVLEIVLNGYALPLCSVKIALAQAAGYASTSVEAEALLDRTGFDDVSSNLLMAIAGGWDEAYEIREGLIGGIPHVQILPGLNGSVDPTVAGRAIVGWNDFAEAANGAICPPARTVTAAEAGPGVSVEPEEAAQPVVVQNAPTTVAYQEPVQQPVPEMPNVPPSLAVGNNIPLAQDSLRYAAKDSFQAPTFTVMVPEEELEPEEEKPLPWGWIGLGLGVLAVGGGVYVTLRSEKRARRRSR